MLFWGETLQVVGTVMVAYMAIAVHYRVRKEHRVDDNVFKMMEREQIVGVVGIVFIVAGYALKVYAGI